MAIDPISWAVGFGLSKVANILLTRAVQAKLRGALHIWANKLPPDFHLTPGAFSVAKRESDTAAGSRRELLGQVLEAGHVPSIAVWKAALLERCQEIRNAEGNDAQLFFLKSEDEIDGHVQELAASLHIVCVDDPRLRDRTVFEHTSAIPGLSDRMANIERLLEPEDDKADLNQAKELIRQSKSNEAIVVLRRLRERRWDRLD